MAVFFPRDPLPGTSDSELKVRAALRDLDDDWTVLHGVAWQSVRDGRPGDGEADFVLVNPAHGMLVMEVKGGGIRLERGAWSSVDRHGESHPIKNPFEQVTASKHALIGYLKQRGVSTLPAGHAVVFPDLGEPVSFGPAAPGAITWVRSDLRNVASALTRTLRRWKLTAPFPREYAERVRSLLAPTVTAIPLLREKIEDVKAGLLRLTDEQILVMRGLRRNRRAIVFGRAGTGKTILAVEEAKRLAKEGFRVLLLCYNHPLAAAIAETLRGVEGATAATFHTFCLSEVREAGHAIPQNKSQKWWDEVLPSLMPQSVSDRGHGFDALVVDEGQDFDPAWWIVLQLILLDPDNSPMFVFADTQQAIYRQGWQPPFREPAFDLEINCRNSLTISQRVADVFGDDCNSLGVPGPEPIFRPANGFGEVGGTIVRALTSLLEEQRLAPEQVVVLSGRKDVVDVLRGQEFGSLRLVGPGETGVVVETIHRFKGLESDAVLLVFSTFRPGEDDSLLYIGMSRARAYLEVIGPDSLGERLGWPTPAAN